MKKKKYLITLLLTLIMSSVIGCADSALDDYTTVVESVTNDGIISKSETECWSGEYFKHRCPKEFTCDVLGYSLKGKYNRSIIDKYNSYTTNIYVCEDGIEFGIRDDNNKIVLINLMNKDFFDTQPYLEDVDDSEEYCRSYASEIASKFINNIDTYKQMSDEPRTKTKEKEGKTYYITYYVFTFYKDIAGYNSSDYISVKVTSKGHVASVIIGDTDVFEDKSFLIDKGVLQGKIDEKILQVYSSTEYSVTSHTILDQKIVKAPDGNFCIVSDVDIELVDNDNHPVQTLLGLISILK